MAALAFCFCAVIRELYAVSNAFVRCGCDVHKVLNYIRAKNRLRLFRKYCEAVWLQYEYESLVDYASDTNSNNNSCGTNKNGRRLHRPKMRRGRISAGNAEIDFAAYEAEAIEKEASEGYLMSPEENHFDELDPCRKRDSIGQEMDFEDFENPDDIEVVSGVEADVSYYDHIDSHPQCRDDNLGDLGEGVCFIVNGRILLTCERFSINFLIENPTRDVALHINPRLPQNYVVRNTRVRNVWGREEIATQLPFNLHRGTKFSIQVLITENSFMISSNGYHFADYKHRLPYRTIKAIEVKGDVEDVSITRQLVSSYPERQPEITKEIPLKRLDTPFRVLPDGTIPLMAFYDALTPDVIVQSQWRQTTSMRNSLSGEKLPMPYIGHFKQNSLTIDRALCFKGRVKLLPHSFYINLQEGRNIWPHQNIAFHFNPRFTSHGGATLGKAIVCRNAWYNGQWGKEERSELDTNLRPGKFFELMIRCTKDSFKVYVDRKIITSFNYQLQPSTIDTVYVRGDVQLDDVSLLVPTLPTDPVTNITENPHEFEYNDKLKIGAKVKQKGDEATEQSAN